MRSHKKPHPNASTKLSILRNIDDLRWEMQAVQLEIARRAYELFETRGGDHGHDWEDWFRAESELLRPTSAVISESDDRISVRVNVLGFEEKELSVGVEPRRIAILGKKQVSVTESEGGKLEYIDWSPDLIMAFVDLPADVSPEKPVIELHTGVLKLELAKSTKNKVGISAAAA